MSDVSQNPTFHLSKPPHKLSNIKNKPSKKTTRSKNKNNNNNCSTFSKAATTNNNNKPLKVVHISNPMKFQVAAAEFRALVQGLTGRDAVVEWPEDHHDQAVVAAADVTEDDSANSGNSTDYQVHDHQNHHHHHHDHDHDHEEVVNLSACFGPSDHHLMSFDYYGGHFNGDVIVDGNVEHSMVIMEDLQAFLGDDDQSLLHY